MNEAFKLENPLPSPSQEVPKMTTSEREAGARLEEEGVIRHIVDGLLDGLETTKVTELLKKGRTRRRTEKSLKRARKSLDKSGDMLPIPDAMEALSRTVANRAAAIQDSVPNDELGIQIANTLNPFIAEDVAAREEEHEYDSRGVRMDAVAFLIHRAKVDMRHLDPRWKQKYPIVEAAHEEFARAYAQLELLEDETYTSAKSLHEYYAEREMLARQKEALTALRTVLQEIPDDERLSSNAYAEMLGTVEPPLPDMVYDYVAKKIGGRERFISGNERKALDQKFTHLLEGYELMMSAYDRSIEDMEQAFRKR